MDWNLVYIATGAVLNALVLGIWKPWGGAYAGEKGKNFARKEDLNEILAEVRAVTITQKEIEAKLSGELFNRQMQLNQKKDIYGQLLKATQEFASNCRILPTIRRLRDEATTDVSRAHMMQQYTDHLGKATEAQTALNQAFALARIFAGEQCVTLINAYSFEPLADLESTSGCTEQANRLNILLFGVISAAKTDLGIIGTTIS